MVHGKCHDSPIITPTNFIDQYLINKIFPNAQYEHLYRKFTLAIYLQAGSQL